MEEASIGETEENIREHGEYSRITQDITGPRTNTAQLFPLINKIPDHHLKRFAKEVNITDPHFRFHF